MLTNNQNVTYIDTKTRISKQACSSQNRATYASWSSAREPAGTHCFSGRVSVVRKAKPPPQTMVKSTLPISVLISAQRGRMGRRIRDPFDDSQVLGLARSWAPATRRFGKHVTTFAHLFFFFKNQAFNPFAALQCGLVTGCVPTTLPIFSKKLSKQRSTAPHPSEPSQYQ